MVMLNQSLMSLEKNKQIKLACARFSKYLMKKKRRKRRGYFENKLFTYQETKQNKEQVTIWKICQQFKQQLEKKIRG